eukprot:UN1416
MLRDYQDMIARVQGSSTEGRAQYVDLSTSKCTAHADPAYELAVKILGDHDFLLAHTTAAWALSRHAPVYAYVFSDESVRGSRLAHHGADHNFVFGTASYKDDDANNAASLSSEMMKAWAAFAHTGTPATPSLGAWPPISFPAGTTMGLPAGSKGWEHMHFEHGRLGLVSHGGDETCIWLKHSHSLAAMPTSTPIRLRPATEAMAAALSGDGTVSQQPR